MTQQTQIADTRRWYPCVTAGVLALLVVACTAPLASAQPSDPAGEIEFTVREATTHARMVKVPVNQGVMVEFNAPIEAVSAANPEIVDVVALSTRQVLVNGRAYGTTQVIVGVEGGGKQMFTVAVDLDLARLQAAIENAVPQARVKASGMLDTVVLSGTVPNAEGAEQIMQIAGVYAKDVINHMRVAGVQQVLLRCTVAEVNRTATRQLGFNGWMAGQNFGDAFGVSQLGGINPVNIGGAAGIDVTGRIPFGTDSSDGLPLTTSPTLSIGFPKVQMQVFIRALRENGLLQVLAEPNLVTISGQEASFLAGGEFPVPVPQRDSVTIDFKQFGVRLNFTPTVLGPNTIRLQVAPEVSEPDFTNSVSISGWVIPGLVSRRVETVVELGPGQTFAIGGLLSEQTRAVSSKVPALGDLPVLGALFTSTDYQHSESELVVLVTPELVSPLNPGQVPYVPGADHVAPNDWELFVLGKLDGEGDPNASDADDSTAPSGTGSSPTALRLRGPIGFAGPEEGA